MAEIDIFRPFEGIILRPNETEANRQRIADRLTEAGRRFIQDEEELEVRAGFLINVMSAVPKLGVSPIHLHAPDHYFPDTQVSLSFPLPGDTTPLYNWMEQDLQAALRAGMKMREFMIMGQIDYLQFSHLEFTVFQHAEGDAKLLMIYPYQTHPMTIEPVALPRPLNGMVKTLRANEIRRDNLLEFIGIVNSV